MKVCLQCKTAYDEDYIFCLLDGNALVDDGPEVETVVNRKFTMPTPDDGTAVYCVSCGLANKAHSKFCKKCGKPMDAASPASPPFGFGQFGNAGSGGPAFGETVTFQPPKFVSSSQAVSVSSSSSNRNVLLAIAAAVVILIGIVYLILSDKPSSPGFAKTDNGGSSSTSSSEKRSETIFLPDTFDRYYEGSVDGRRQSMNLTMHLKRDKSILTGSAETAGAYDELSGSIDTDGSFQVNGTPAGQPTTGIWSGRISADGTIKGNWMSLDGRKSSPFSATEKK